MTVASSLITRSRVWSISGGIHPAEHKQESNTAPIEAIPLPSTLWLPLNMHIGAPATPVVSVGQMVRKGQIIAQSGGGISASVHAPTSGRITAIEDHAYAHESGLKQPAIAIEADGLDDWRKQTPWEDWASKTHEELLQRIHDGGITGLGGAGFPTDIKYRNRHAPIDTLLINAAECEPYITADDRLMRERAEDILRGAQICLHLLGARRILIGIEDNKPEAATALEQAAETLQQRIELAVVPTKYPSGGEKQLIQLVTGKEVPKGGLPSDLGIVCQNVGTLYQIYRTVVHDEPLISRITTVTGAAVSNPGNYEVLIGTSMETVLNHAGAHLKKADRVIMGGPMMGFAVPDIAAPIMKSTNCLLAPTKKELPPAIEDSPCIRCGLCEQACPVDLLPQQMHWASKHRELESAELHSLEDCIECGACAYVCPSRIPLVQYFRYAKGELKQERQQHEESERARIRFENRQARLEREKQEKEARRKARAEAAAKAQAEKKAREGAPSSGSNDDDPVKAALARAAAKKQARAESAAAVEQSPAELKEALDKAKAKFDKASTRLQEAEANGDAMVAALKKAADKLEEKYLSAEKAYQAATQSQETDPS
ncbi:electron transport complex subunit RsxC [Reinekea blandensis]|uniref:Ion-translocating oxidoreductase complex subunit C n=1 Tax=Reinekea blandensis MED297 TaxID=314283 RepID=A4BH74_9GAMM|nr:electron transport complex subunit RsxC [Reinekea blandensis]EAR08573.1 predicted NADH:ubiquinone oxidoreductase, subunit RnfC [Reinekea sp. MED297] [Reinekea blandensis MED297]